MIEAVGDGPVAPSYRTSDVWGPMEHKTSSARPASRAQPRLRALLYAWTAVAVVGCDGSPFGPVEPLPVRADCTGAAGCPCAAGSACNDGLVCSAGTCAAPTPGVPSLDAGLPPVVDAGLPPLVDAGPTTDAGTPPGPAPDAGQPGGPGTFADENPNDLDSSALFTCADPALPRSSPARLRRLEALHWERQILDDDALRVPLQNGTGHRYSTYSSDETLDPPTIREYLRYGGYGSWVNIGGNGFPRLAILRNGDAGGRVRCFQWSWNDQPVNAEPDEACTEEFARTLLEEGVLFRPATVAEVASLAAYADAQVVKEIAGEQDRRASIRLITQAAWMTTGALFRSEMGIAETDGDGGPEDASNDDERRRLSDWELAQTLALALTDTTVGVSKPGYGSADDLYQVRLGDFQDAAADGSIQDPAVREALVRKYLFGTDPVVAHPDSPATDYPPDSLAFQDTYWTSPKLRRFFREWLDYSGAHAVFKDTPQATSGFNSASQMVPEQPWRLQTYHDRAFNGQNLVQHLDDTIARIVVEDVDVFSKLLTSRRFLLPHSGDCGGATGPQRDCMDHFYGTLFNIDVFADGPVEDTLDDRWRTLPETERAGVLTHPAWLSAHGGNFENDPSVIHRGRWVYDELLCGVVPDLPSGVDAMLDPSTNDQSARQRLTEQLDNRPECAACHQLMNPIGYTFEIYNHAGFIRTDDHGAAPSGAATIPVFPAEDGVLQNGLEVSGAPELMETLAQSPRAKRCFVRQSFRFFTGRNERYADACTLADMEAAYDANGSMADMLVALFASDTFLYRHDDDDGGSAAEEVQP